MSAPRPRMTVTEYRDLTHRLHAAITTGGRVLAHPLAVPPAPNIGEPLIDPDVQIVLVATMRSGDRRVEIPLAHIASIEPAEEP